MGPAVIAVSFAVAPRLICTTCYGDGKARPPTKVDRDGRRLPCDVCLGDGDVEHRGIAFALSAWRWCRERGRTDAVFAHLLAIARDPSCSTWMRRTFVDVDALVDLLMEAGRVDPGAPLPWSGRAAWSAMRWARSTRTTRDPGDRERLQVLWWSEVLPEVLPLATRQRELAL